MKKSIVIISLSSFLIYQGITIVAFFYNHKTTVIKTNDKTCVKFTLNE